MMQSETHYLAKLNSTDLSKLTRIEIYLACIIPANNGKTFDLEKELSPIERELLTARRWIHLGELENSKRSLLKIIESSKEDLYRGDAEFLMGAIEHRSGRPKECAHWMNEAATTFENAGFHHRKLRALINSFICQGSLEIYLTGPLMSLEQEARRSQFYDLIANISRGRAHELMVAENFQAAIQELKSSVEAYDFEGSPDEKAISMCMIAICQLQIGHSNEAQETISRVLIKTGKVSVYHELYSSLFNGKIPQLPQGHPMTEINWVPYGFKPLSIPGKIVERLRKGPSKRDELIAYVWGPQAIDPSYNSRLYTAINQTKKSGKVTIVFDGENYRLIM